MEISVSAEQLNPRRTFLCGQCFRWEDASDGFVGTAYGRRIFVTERNGNVTISGFPKNEEQLWRQYFDLDTDYSEYISRLSADPTLNLACHASLGIHILRQEPFETLLSFIISQNNNIPRISGIVGRLCETFGDVIENNTNEQPCFSFPTAKRLDGIEEGDLAPLRAGFRARYIVDAVRRINSGEVDFSEIDALPLDKARQRLKTIIGVGDKVADCVLLFAFHKLDAFPKDVWVKRIMAQYYPDGLPDCTLGIEGVAQQYLFDYIRNKTAISDN